MAAYNPYGPPSQPPSSFTHIPSADMASFDSRLHSFSGHNQAAHHYASMPAPSHSHHMSQTSVSSFRSAAEPNGHTQQQPALQNPQIYTVSPESCASLAATTTSNQCPGCLLERRCVRNGGQWRCRYAKALRFVAKCDPNSEGCWYRQGSAY